MTIRFLSVCSGLEGASLAFKPLGWAAVGFSEIEAFPSAIIAERYGSNLPSEPLSGNAPPNFGDFTAIDLSLIGDVDILVGGTPCQAFSIAGKRLSLSDARGNLTLAYAVLAHELARSHGLRNCLWENVPGCLSTADNAFGCFLGALVGGHDAILPCARPSRGRSNIGWTWKKERREPILDDDGIETGEFTDRPAEHVVKWPSSGMASGPRSRLAWRVLDAQYFGVAQQRERVFVVADFGNGADPCQVLFESIGLQGNNPPSREKREGITAFASSSIGSYSEVRGSGGTLRSHGGDYGGGSENIVVHGAFNWQSGGDCRGLDLQPVTMALSKEQTPAIAFDARQADVHGDIMGTMRAAGGNADIPTIAFAVQEDNQNGVKVSDVAGSLRSDAPGTQPCGTLAMTTVATQWAVRRLTPIEAERLQGIPDNYTRIPWRGKPSEDCPDGPRYRALGNSWAVPVVSWIGRRLDDAIKMTDYAA